MSLSIDHTFALDIKRLPSNYLSTLEAGYSEIGKGLVVEERGELIGEEEEERKRSEQLKAEREDIRSMSPPLPLALKQHETRSFERVRGRHRKRRVSLAIVSDLEFNKSHPTSVIASNIRPSVYTSFDGLGSFSGVTDLATPRRHDSCAPFVSAITFKSKHPTPSVTITSIAPHHLLLQLQAQSP
jgi:hypothetical protein